GSTRRWELEPDAMRQALVRHDAMIGACVKRQNGFVVKSKGEGDSVFAVFCHVRDAVSAALIIQCALAVDQWPTSTPIKVRMAIHTGQIELREGDYYGPTVNRCARLRALAKGGQVLLSGVTAQLVQGQLPPAATLKDLGTHQLKDLTAPERVWQLSHPQFAVSPPPAPTSAVRATLAPTPMRRAYKLTDHLNQSAEGLEWGSGVKHKASGADVESRIRCYTTPTVAALMNAQYERLRLPRLWEAIVDVEPVRGDAIVACGEVATTRQVTMPTLTGLQHAVFAVLCTRAAYDGGLREQEFTNWSDGWLNGQDNSGVNARALADLLESDCHGSIGLSHPELMMAAKAARAAMHASKLSWLAGRARDEENSRAIELATEAVQTALRMAQLDVPSLAEQAVPKPTSAIPPARVQSVVTSTRILTALPT
ncbi:MAG TPA: adenylate/guanylate cyclase domain-containing protein, partial [Chloroflexota bacterium]|nr:adenylate/guanylate cyclase domain-containing protein [Chloroflexota bacterium]